MTSFSTTVQDCMLPSLLVSRLYLVDNGTEFRKYISNGTVTAVGNIKFRRHMHQFLMLRNILIYFIMFYRKKLSCSVKECMTSSCDVSPRDVKSLLVTCPAAGQCSWSIRAFSFYLISFLVQQRVSYNCYYCSSVFNVMVIRHSCYQYFSIVRLVLNQLILFQSLCIVFTECLFSIIYW